MKFVPSIITVYLPKSNEIVEPESIHQVPSIPETHSICKFVRQINGRGDCSIDGGRPGSLLHSMVQKKLLVLFMVTRSLVKVIASVHRAGNGKQKMEINGCNVPFVSSGFTKHVLHLNLIFNLVSDGNSVFFISLINCSWFIRFRNYDEMACSDIILHQHVQN